MHSLSRMATGALALIMAATLSTMAAGKGEPSPSAQKWAALKTEVATLKAAKKLDAILALYLQALESPDFQNSPERGDLLEAMAKFHISNQNFEKAADYYAQALRLDHLARPRAILFGKALAKTLIAQNKVSEGLAEYAKLFTLPDLKPQERAGIHTDLASTFEDLGDFAKAREEFQKALDDKDVTPAMAKNILAAQAAFFKNRGDWQNFQQTLEALRKVDPTIDASTLYNYAILAKKKLKLEEEEKAWDEILGLSHIPPRIFMDLLSRKMILLAGRGDTEGIKRFIASLEGRTVTDEQRAFLTVLSSALAVPGNDWKQFKIPPLNSLDAEKQANAFFETGKVMMYLGNYDAARFFAEKGESLFGKSPERLYNVPFVAQAPRGVSGWEASPLIKDPSCREDRFEEYNKKAADLLINDVNATRTIASGDTTKKAPVAFYMAADARGWHVYLQYTDADAEQVLAGLRRGGNLEMYMEPGKGEAYYQFIIDVPSGNLEFTAWSSPYNRYRKLDDYLVSEVAPIDGGFGVSLVFPWEVIYDKLPKPGDRWPFGVVNFGRDGAFTWGSGQVHELNRFGKVTFPEISKALPAIHRWITLKAYAKYLKSAETAKLIWNDPEKGDPQFFETLLAPEIARLDELGKSVSTTMSESDSEKLFQEAVPLWMEFDYWVADQRTRYLKSQLMTH